MDKEFDIQYNKFKQSVPSVFRYGEKPSIESYETFEMMCKGFFMAGVIYSNEEMIKKIKSKNEKS